MDTIHHNERHKYNKHLVQYSIQLKLKGKKKKLLQMTNEQVLTVRKKYSDNVEPFKSEHSINSQKYSISAQKYH